MFMFFRIERPTTATLRPFAIATSAACCTRCMFDANDATMMRPLRSGISCRNASPTSRSEPVIPGRSAFVESPSSRSTPRLPSSASAPTSVLSPSTGVWSSFQSPVCSTRPASVSIDDRHRVGDRVRHADELERERPEAHRRAAGLRLGEPRGRREPVLVELRLDEPERQPGADHLADVDLAQEVRQPADVILVRVGQHDGEHRAVRRGTRRRRRTRSTPKCSSRGNARPASTRSARRRTRRRSCSCRPRRARRAG